MWSQMCTMPRELSKGLAEFCLIGGPPNSRRILLWGIAMSPRSSIAIAQLFFLEGESGRMKVFALHFEKIRILQRNRYNIRSLLWDKKMKDM